MCCLCRSIIFTNETLEARLAAASKEREQTKSRTSIVTTQIQHLGAFYPAEFDHQVLVLYAHIRFHCLSCLNYTTSDCNINEFRQKQSYKRPNADLRQKLQNGGGTYWQQFVKK